MIMERKKFTKNLAIIKKAKTDVERKNKLLQEKRIKEIHYGSIQKRLQSKLDRLGKKLESNLDIKQIGEFPSFGTQNEMQLQKRKNPQKIAGDIIEEWDQNIMNNFKELKAENEVLNEVLRTKLEDLTTELEEFRQKYPALIKHRDCNGPVGPHLYNANADGIDSEQSKGKQSEYDFYLDKLTELFTKFSPDYVDKIQSQLRKYPHQVRFIYESVCDKFGITPVSEYVSLSAVSSNNEFLTPKESSKVTNHSLYSSYI